MNAEVLYKAANIFLKLSYDNSIKEIVKRLGREDIIPKDIADDTIEEWYKTNQSILDKFVFIFSLGAVIGVDTSKHKFLTFNEDLSKEDPDSEAERFVISSHDMTKENFSKSTLMMKYPFNANFSIAILDKNYIRGVNNIPDLYLYVVKRTKEIQEGLSEDYNLYSYISTPIFKFFKADYNFVKQIIDTNKNKLDQIAKWFKNYPRLLGSGVDGTAYSIGDGKILKLFTNKYSYNAAKKSMDYLYEKPGIGKTETMIYDLGELDLGNNRKMYYYIMEELQVFEKSSAYQDMNMLLTDIVSKCNFYIQQNKEDMSKVNIEKNFRKLSPHIRNMVNEINEYNGDYIKYYTKTYNLNKKWLERFVEEVLVKLITKREDLNLWNLGITNNGFFRFFDSAFGL